MSALSNIPKHAVLPLGQWRMPDLRKAAAQADQRLLEADVHGVAAKADILNQLAHSFLLPKHFGNNLDALYDCITDMQPLDDSSHPGFIVVLENLPGPKHSDVREAILDVFREAGDFFFDRNIAFRVFYSVASA
jgi:RNAse (barnase) inhibitor barstar